MAEIEVYDLTIIGGGPAGLYGAFYAGLREMKVKIIEAQPELGGKIHVYPEKVIWDVGGSGPVTGAEFMKQLIQQGLTFDPEVVLNEKVKEISKRSDGVFILTAEAGSIHYSKTVMIAIGSGILKPQKLELEGAERYEIANLHYMVQSIKHFKDKTILISGGGNSAIDWANLLEPVAKKVYHVHRRETFTAHEAQVTQLKNSSVQSLPSSSISKLIADKNQLAIDQVEVTHHETGEITTIAVDEVLIHHGFDRDASLLENSELEIQLRDNYYVSGTSASETSVAGLFAAGDILKHDGKLHLIAGAFQDAANAVNKAKQYLEPDASAAAMVSSHNEVFANRNKQLISEMLK